MTENINDFVDSMENEYRFIACCIQFCINHKDLFDSYVEFHGHEELISSEERMTLLRQKYNEISHLEIDPIVKKVAGRLQGMNKEDLATAERQIANILIDNSILSYDEYGNLI